MCGIFGVYGHPEAANITYLGLHALQHRGQESAGIVTSDGERFHQQKDGPGRRRLLQGELASLPGDSPSVTSATRPPAAPAFATPSRSPSSTRTARIAVAHNGNLVNAADLRRQPRARRLASSSRRATPRSSST